MIHTQISDDHPASQVVIDDLYRVLTAEAASGRIRATAVCADALVTPPGRTKSDALRAEVEHADRLPVQVFEPYKKKRLRGFEFGEQFVSDGTPRLDFAKPS